MNFLLTLLWSKRERFFKVIGVILGDVFDMFLIILLEKIIYHNESMGEILLQILFILEHLKFNLRTLHVEYHIFQEFRVLIFIFFLLIDVWLRCLTAIIETQAHRSAVEIADDNLQWNYLVNDLSPFLFFLPLVVDPTWFQLQDVIATDEHKPNVREHPRVLKTFKPPDY